MSSRRAFNRVLVLAGTVSLVGLFPRSSEAQDTSAYERDKALAAQTARSVGLWTGPQAPVVLSFSGGISLGAYQAGVNWAMVQFIKATRSSAKGLLADIVHAAHVPSIPVDAMSGASAGNINVLLASIEYCDPRLDRPAESSLFWEMWVRSGWDELFPETSRQLTDPGVLDRSQSLKRVRDSVEAALSHREVEPGCDVPIGVVLTRVDPRPVSLDPSVAYQTQRQIVLFEAKEMAGRLRFMRPADGFISAEALGLQAVLRTNASGEVEMNDLFDAVKASSSYPIAFAPVRLVYETPAKALGHGGSLDTARFLDGGVFDNNPIGLAVGLQQILSVQRARPTAKARVLFVDPNAAQAGSRLDSWVRHRAAVNTATRSHNGDANGIGALQEFGGGFIPSAREYELQQFARQRSALPPAQQAAIRSSTRERAVIGEHLNAFAAFFGRPFREFDFYVGIADGVRFVVSEILCGDGRPALAAQADASMPVALSGGTADQRLDACVATQTQRLATNGAFPLDPVGRRTVLQILKRDYPALIPAPIASLSFAVQGQATVLDAIETATYDKLQNAKKWNSDCTKGLFLGRALCADGFSVVLKNLRGSSAAMDVLECSEGGSCQSGLRYPTPIEQTRQLIVDPVGTLDKYVTQALVRMRNVEKQENANKREGSAGYLKLGEMIARSADDYTDWGYDGGPSSIPAHDGFRSAIYGALPYFAGPTLGKGGFLLGWQPTLHLVRNTILETPFGVFRNPRDLTSPNRPAAATFITPSAGLEFRNGWVNQVAIGARLETVGSLTKPQFGARFVTAEYSAYLIGRMLRLNAYRAPSSYTGNRNRWIGGIALADVNGLLYWILR
jgi:predicted acylesterase/phospholipase RssA